MINENIPGWILKNDLIFLSYISKIMIPNKIIVEVGSHCGRSSWTLAKNLSNGSQLHCIDTWEIDDIYYPEGLGYVGCNCSESEKEFARNLAREHHSWLPVFKHYTRDFPAIQTFQCKSSDYKVDTTLVAAVFLDGGHDFETADNDLTKFNFNDEVLLFGDDFTPSFLGQVEAVLKHQRRSNKILIQMPKSEFWFLWPRTGHFSNYLTHFINVHRSL